MFRDRHLYLGVAHMDRVSGGLNRLFATVVKVKQLGYG